MGNIRNRIPYLLEDMRTNYGITGPLVHVGAHDGEEVPLYRRGGIRENELLLIEPLPEKVAALKIKYPEADVRQCACSNFTGFSLFNVGKKTNQSSLNHHPDDNIVGNITVKVEKLRDVVTNDARIAVIDAQGHELEVMQYLPDSVELMIVETAPVVDVSMASKYDDVVSYAQSIGFFIYDEWTRNYSWLYEWCRGKSIKGVPGNVIDVIFLKDADDERALSQSNL